MVLLVTLVATLTAWTTVFAPPANPQSARATLSSEQAGTKLYTEHVREVLDQHCRACHNSSTKQGGLDLTTRQGLVQGGTRGPAVVPGNAGESLLYKLITHRQEPYMPLQGQRIPSETASLIELWIDLGAPFEAAPTMGEATHAAHAGMRSEPTSQAFFEKVRPVLETRCLNCHGGKLRQAGLDISTREKLLRGSDTHKDVVVPGRSGDSLLMKKIKHLHEPGMPYRSQNLPEEAIANMAAWIDANAPYSGALRASGEQGTSPQGSSHWAYKPPRRPPLPKIRRQVWERNPIDAFIAEQHERRNLEPVPEADKRTLIRRVYLDLIGFPPAPNEIDAFLKDNSSTEYETVVDRLLSSPAYGERWGRHWMDVWRYSDWYGLRSSDLVQSSQRHLWHWRDWIVESLNEDKGYDRMILEMLAGDEIAPTDPKTLRATGYLARNWFKWNRHAWLNEAVEHTAAGFLSTTLKCARCHDHKFDPIAQEEYYRFRAFFEPYDVRIDPMPGQANLVEAGLPRVFDSEPRGITEAGPAIYAETYRLIGGDEKNPDKERPLSPAVPEALGKLGEPIQPVQLPPESYYPFLQVHVQRDMLEQARREIEKAQVELAEAKKALALAEQRAAVPQQHEESLKAAHAAFEKELKPIFDKHCLVCHGDYYGRNEFRVLSVASLLEGGTDDGPAVIPGNSARSPLILRLRGERQPRMPGEAAPLPKEVIERIAQWIDHLPPADAQLAVRKAQEALALAERKLPWNRAHMAALEARIAADQAQFRGASDAEMEALGKSARAAERSAELLKAEMSVLDAQQKLADALRAPPPNQEGFAQVREKRVTTATAQLKAAQEALARGKDRHTPVGKHYPKTSTGRRTALARWIVRKDNPLTARVAVNHLWMRHFGEPLVASVDDFGVRTAPPSHPELLDWLAVEFMENHWSMKHLHRLIVTSRVYRLGSNASRPNHSNVSVDPKNQFLWRMNQRRMEAETIRDSVLFAAGELDRTLGGPELDHYTGQTSRRRSLYFTHTPNENMQFLKLFDLADPTGCYRRFESIQPQQALALSNSELSFTQSRLLARKISETVGGDSRAFVAAAFERVLARAPGADEEAESLRFLRQQAQLLTNATKLTPFQSGEPSEVPAATEPALRAREGLVHVLLNRNEFVTIR
ncbi:MAG: DUF1553 domain-containing protein [Acidimicrobiia bacterium]|nr:DUF1553 domain-containing protein [Acidimicrobiia bacterium]